MFMLENLRYDEGEEKNNDKFSKMLSQFGEIYVSDAFGTSHRKHSSTYGVTNYIPGYAGFLIKSFNSSRDTSRRTFTACGFFSAQSAFTVITRLTAIG